MGELRPASVLQSDRLEGRLSDLINFFGGLRLHSSCLFSLVHESALAMEVLDNVTAFRLHLVPPLHCILLRFSRQQWLLLKLLVGRDFGRLANPWLFLLLIRLGLKLVDVETSELSCYFCLSALTELQKAFSVKDKIACESLFILLSLAVNLTIWLTNASNHHKKIGQVLLVDTISFITL